jgi:hypothetical protein
MKGRPCLLRRTLTFALAISAFAVEASCVSREELRRQDEAVCTGYGFQPGTNDFADCLQRESLARLYATAPPPYWGYWGPVLGAALLPSPPSRSDSSHRSATQALSAVSTCDRAAAQSALQSISDFAGGGKDVRRSRR